MILPIRIALRLLAAPGLAALVALTPATVHAQTAQQASQTPQTLPAVTLNAGIHVIRAMVARSPQERSIGLMYRTDMAPNDGMLFVFEGPATQCFWMKNTPLPLSAAFIDDDGSIINIEDMQPQTTDSHCSKQPVRYVLEMHRGWFEKRGLKAGSRLTGAPLSR